MFLHAPVAAGTDNKNGNLAKKSDQLLFLLSTSSHFVGKAVLDGDAKQKTKVMTIATQSDYALGHSQREIMRMISQAATLRPITGRLLRSVKIGTGMRVLDLGCGAGDVSMLAAQFVGPTGLVVGIDRNPELITLASERAYAAGLRQIRYTHAPVESFSYQEPFDRVIGRDILAHQSDPVDFIRVAARLLSPGGSIAFQEIRLLQGFESRPAVPLWQVTGDLILTVCKSLPHHDVSDRLIQYFFEAGLPQPNVFCETPVGGGIDSPLYAWAAETLRSFQPQLAKMGILFGELAGMETLENRLREAVVAAHSQIVHCGQVCAWASTGPQLEPEHRLDCLRRLS
jgi:ubiquinone/menaquinone biosynthesis C-methylase UbiE